jgi:hypothetical protein
VRVQPSGQCRPRAFLLIHEAGTADRRLAPEGEEGAAFQRVSVGRVNLTASGSPATGLDHHTTVQARRYPGAGRRFASKLARTCWPSPPPGDALHVAPMLLAPATGDMLKTRPELNDDWGGEKGARALRADLAWKVSSCRRMRPGDAQRSSLRSGPKVTRFTFAQVLGCNLLTYFPGVTGRSRCHSALPKHDAAVFDPHSDPSLHRCFCIVTSGVD